LIEKYIVFSGDSEEYTYDLHFVLAKRYGTLTGFRFLEAWLLRPSTYRRTDANGPFHDGGLNYIVEPFAKLQDGKQCGGSP
jgi:hypothetical protein